MHMQKTQSLRVRAGGGRFAVWPKVRAFLQQFAAGDVVADVGCGNGKYFQVRPPLAARGSRMLTPPGAGGPPCPRCRASVGWTGCSAAQLSVRLLQLPLIVLACVGDAGADYGSKMRSLV